MASALHAIVDCASAVCSQQPRPLLPRGVAADVDAGSSEGPSAVSPERATLRGLGRHGPRSVLLPHNRKGCLVWRAGCDGPAARAQESPRVALCVRCCRAFIDSARLVSLETSWSPRRRVLVDLRLLPELVVAAGLRERAVAPCTRERRVNPTLSTSF